MRVMVQFWFPAEPGNDIVRTGKVGQVFQRITDELKPEAAYFFPNAGERSGLFVINMQDSSEVAQVAERFFHGLNARIDMTPVMNAEDIQKALSHVETIVKNYG